MKRLNLLVPFAGSAGAFLIGLLVIESQVVAWLAAAFVLGIGLALFVRPSVQKYPEASPRSAAAIFDDWPLAAELVRITRPLCEERPDAQGALNLLGIRIRHGLRDEDEDTPAHFHELQAMLVDLLHVRTLSGSEHAEALEETLATIQRSRSPFASLFELPE